MRRFNILHVLTLGGIAAEITRLAYGGEFGTVGLVLLVAAPIAAVLSFIVSTHDGKPKVSFFTAMDALLVGALLALVGTTIAPLVYTASFGVNIGVAISAGVLTGFYAPKRYRDGLLVI